MRRPVRLASPDEAAEEVRHPPDFYAKAPLRMKEKRGSLGRNAGKCLRRPLSHAAPMMTSPKQIDPDKDLSITTQIQTLICPLSEQD